MKTRLLPIFIAASFFGSCKKDDKAPEPPKEFIQVQQVDFSDGILNFYYNDQHQLSKADILYHAGEGNPPVLSAYIAWTYQDGFPTKAEVFNKSGSNFRKTMELHYKADAQKRIAYVAQGRLSENSSMQWGDTTDFAFNASNKLISTRYREEGEEATIYAYDNNGNYKGENELTTEENNTYEYKYEHQYDNNTNPLSVNGLGITLFSIFRGELFDVPQVLSSNNPVLAKSVYLRKTLDDNGQPTYTYQITSTREYSNTLDENGGLKQVNIKSSNESKENGTVTNSSSNNALFKYTCIKKQQ